MEKLTQIYEHMINSNILDNDGIINANDNYFIVDNN